MSNFFNAWYVIYTKPHHEKKVEKQLLQNNIKTFLPTRKVTKQWHDRKKVLFEPLFPSYIFAYLDTVESFYRGLEVSGALYYVRYGKRIAQVKEEVINNIKLSVEANLEFVISTQHFEVGQKIVIGEGVLEGLSCEIVQVDGKKRILVRVELLNRNLLLSLKGQNQNLIEK